MLLKENTIAVNLKCRERTQIVPDELGLRYLEASSERQTTVDKLFETIARLIVETSSKSVVKSILLLINVI